MWNRFSTEVTPQFNSVEVNSTIINEVLHFSLIEEIFDKAQEL